MKKILLFSLGMFFAASIMAAESKQDRTVRITNITDDKIAVQYVRCINGNCEDTLAFIPKGETARVTGPQARATVKRVTYKTYTRDFTDNYRCRAGDGNGNFVFLGFIDNEIFCTLGHK